MHRYLVQSSTASTATERVVNVGGQVRQVLPIINGVAADLSSAQVAKLRRTPNVHLFEDRPIGTRGGKAPPLTVLTDGMGVSAKPNQYRTDYPFLVGADLVQAVGITGKGGTLSVVDTGICTGGGYDFQSRMLAGFDLLCGGNKSDSGYSYGHGTHVTSIA